MSGHRHGGPKHGWTEERLAELKRLIAEGLSGGQIAKRLGGVTRNAVVGKAHRLGLKLAGGLRRVRARRAKTIAVKSEPAPEKLIATSVDALCEVVARPPREDAFRPLPNCTPVPAREAQVWHCCWPVHAEGEDADGVARHCCGAARDPEAKRITRRYCATHGALAVGANERSKIARGAQRAIQAQLDAEANRREARWGKW